jgi:hypothetical protein
LLGWSVLLLFGILDGGSTFPWYSWQEGITFAAAAVLFFVFALIERTAADPIIPPSMLRIRTVSASLSVGLLRQTTFFAAIIYAPLFVQGALGGSVADGRNALYGLAIPFIVGSLISAQAITHGLGYRVTVMTGVVAMVLGTYFTTGLSSHSSILDVTVAVAPVGFGAGLTISATLSAIQNSVARGQIGVATSLLTFVLFLGSSIGLAALGSIQTNALSARLAGVELQPSAQGRAFVSGILANPSLLGNLLSTPQVTAQGIARYPALASLLPQLRDAFATSIVQVFWCVLGLLVVSLVCSFLITGSLRPRARPPQPTARRGKSPLHEEKTGAM